MTGSTNFRASLKLDADAAQYTAELTRAGQTTSTFTTQVQGGGAAASTALQGMTTAAQSAGAGLQAAGQQGAQGLQAMTSAAQARRWTPPPSEGRAAGLRPCVTLSRIYKADPSWS